MAQMFLAKQYFTGDGVPSDYAEAAGWLAKAAEQGFAVARAGLGNMYLEGQGVPQDDVTAYMLFNFALEDQVNLDVVAEEVRNRDAFANISTLLVIGDFDVFVEEVRKNRDALAKTLTPLEIVQAKRLAEEWRARIAADQEPKQ
jgi:TPR repeat protein